MAPRNEEKLIPLIRAQLAKTLYERGHKVKEIAAALKVTPAAVTQYLKEKRGVKAQVNPTFDPVVSALAEKLSQRMKAAQGGVEVVELVEAAYQIMAVSAGERVLARSTWEPKRRRWLEILRQRLELELRAAQRCLEIANHISDEYSKLLLRMIASDSLRHADVVSQVILWLETGHMPSPQPPSQEFISAMLEVEDRAQELSLAKSIRIPHPVAKLLLESIDLDERKHERLFEGMLQLLRKGPKVQGGHGEG